MGSEGVSVLCPSSALGSCLQSMIGLHDGRLLWAPLACDPSQPGDKQGRMGGGISKMGQPGGKLPPKHLTEQPRHSCGCSHPLGGRAAWLYNLDPLSCLREPSLKAGQREGRL